MASLHPKALSELGNHLQLDAALDAAFEAATTAPANATMPAPAPAFSDDDNTVLEAITPGLLAAAPAPVISPENAQLGFAPGHSPDLSLPPASPLDVSSLQPSLPAPAVAMPPIPGPAPLPSVGLAPERRPQEPSMLPSIEGLGPKNRRWLPLGLLAAALATLPLLWGATDPAPQEPPATSAAPPPASSAAVVVRGPEPVAEPATATAPEEPEAQDGIVELEGFSIDARRRSHRNRARNRRRNSGSQMLPALAASAPREGGPTIEVPREPLAPSAVRSVVRRQHTRLRQCYDRALRNGVPQAQNIELRITVAPEGHVAETQIRGASLRGLGACLRTAVSRWRFPASSNGALVPLPIHFEPQG